MRGILSKAFVYRRWKISRQEQTSSQTVIIIMAEIRNAVCRPHDTPLQRFRQHISRMVDNAVLYFKRQIQALSAAFQKLHNPQALLIMGKMTGKFGHRRFSCMAERRMPNIMPKCNRFRQIFIQPQPSGNRSRYLRNFQTVRHPRAVMIPGNDIDLRLMF